MSDNHKGLLPDLTESELAAMPAPAYATQADGQMLSARWGRLFANMSDADIDALRHDGAQVIVLPPWTSAPPTKPGLYRVRRHDFRPEFVEVYESDNSGLEFFVWGDKKPRYVDFMFESEWQGPIEVRE